ncbi:uncharacterized protein LOC131857742 [Cryptomeria japonica]|uniref:uncharacterized protein LOC131857742 n=1 Tax=Cryptomeria japonica TaxID=3369 RepID=UPI0027D9FA25|nr:uncharacterized protein LOC131857742 [Cryptomeria japonica]
MNKKLIRIIKRKIEDNKRNWHTQLKHALWANRITPKRATSISPYVLVYGKEGRLPISVELPILTLIRELEMLQEEPMQIRLVELMELEEVRKQALLAIENHQAQMKKTFDRRATLRVFNGGDLVLKWDELKGKPGKHTKFDAIWYDPYDITEKKQHNSFQL